jgi:hypothetical protein
LPFMDAVVPGLMDESPARPRPSHDVMEGRRWWAL